MPTEHREERNRQARQELGNRLRKLRNQFGWTQEQVAELLGKTVEHVSFLERGERSPSFELLLDIAEIFEISPDSLFRIDNREIVDNLPLPPSIPLPATTSQTVSADLARNSDLARLDSAFAGLREMQKLADAYGVNDVLQDNGGKVLQVLILLGLRISPGREGNDAVDAEGNEYELKTINRSLRKNAGVTTHHHLNKGILDKYRAVKAWYVAIYEGIELKEIYKVYPAQLEELFVLWEVKIQTRGPLNNPKIPMRYIRQGELVFTG
jgi:transcriptional regulator with XRE-family HTH domain